ncbi:MAG: response regulator [Gammaproteobacteria bacterium]|jgi:two-component system chemotaxis response regulator CheY
MLDKNATIMVVDDMRVMRKSIMMFLKALGYSDFIEAENGAEAISKYQSNNVDLVFMDLVMPIQDGYQALKAIKQGDESAMVVMLTSIADQHILDKCMNKGALGYIHKPLTAETAEQKLTDVLEQVA